jgi:hypothetical protein
MVIDMWEDEKDQEFTNRTLCQSYVFCELVGKVFLVSTINRRSSGGYGDWYSETMVWEWDPVAKKRANDYHVAMRSGIVNDVYVHCAVVQQLFTTGVADE